MRNYNKIYNEKKTRYTIRNTNKKNRAAHDEPMR